MDREPVGWTVHRHVVEATLDELDPPRPAPAERYLTVIQGGVPEAPRPDVERTRQLAGGGPPPTP